MSSSIDSVSPTIIFNANSSLSIGQVNQEFITTQALIVLEYLQNNQVTQSQYKRLLDVARISIIEDQSVLHQIATTILQLDQSNFLKGNDEDDQIGVHIIEIVKKLAAKDGEGVSEYIQNYGIKDQNALIEIAKIAAAQDGWTTSEYIQSYGIKDESALIEIAKIAAVQDGKETSEYIQNYGIKDQNALIEIAKIAAAQSGLGISKYIQNYGIKDENALIEIAKIAAVQNGWGTSVFIQNYGIKAENALIAIASIAAAQDRHGPSEYIQNYGIKDQNALIEIAKIAAAQDGWGTSEYIQKYEIKDQNALIEIAKIAAAQNGWRTSEYIQNYGIKDQNALIEIAKIAAAQEGWGTSAHIQNYEIKDENALITIAKIAAAQDGKGTSAYIKRYGIKDQNALITIAKIVAAQDGEKISEYIQNYGIKSENALIEIAKIAAAQNSKGTSKYIQNYGIKDQNALIAIASIAAAQDGKGTSEYIQNYGIKDENALIEIAKIAADQDGEGTCVYLERYNIKNKRVFNTILYLGYGNRWILHAKDLLPKLSDMLKKEEILQSDLIQITKSLYPYLSSFSLNSLTDSILDNLAIQNLPLEKLRALKNQIFWLTSLYIYASSQKIALNHFEPINNYLQDLLRYPDPVMRDKLTIILLESLSKHMLNWQQKVAFSQLPKGYTSLLSLILFALLGESQSALGYAILKKFFHSASSDFGENQRIFIGFLERLYRNMQLSQEEKVHVLNTIFDASHFSSSALKKRQQQQELSAKFKTVLKAMAVTSILCDFNQLQKISSINDLFHQLKTLHQEFDLTTEDMQGNYLNTLGKFRNPHALLTYLGILKQLSSPQKEEAIKWLKQFVREVLDGTFTTKRYASSAHLEMIHTHFPEVLDQWKKGGEISIHEQAHNHESRRDYNKFLFQKLIQDQHLGPDFAKAYPRLAAFLLNLDTNTINLEKLEAHSFEAYCFRLLNPLSKEEETQTLQSLLTVIPHNVEFKNDIEGILETEDCQKKLNISILDTDDPCDLLLIGTEVPGSCQRVNGDAKNSVGLLGYLMDGKIRAVVIKDDKGKIIGRSLIRLLWDNQKKQVVLQQDRYYGNGKYQQLVNEGCKARALALNIPLVIENATSYHLESLGGRCPFEYVDSLGAPARGPIYKL